MSEAQAIVLFNTVVARIVVLSKNGDVTYLPNFEETTNDSTLQASTLYNQNYWTACWKLQQYIGKFGYHICVHSYRKLASPSLIRFTTARLVQYILYSCRFCRVTVYYTQSGFKAMWNYVNFWCYHVSPPRFSYCVKRNYYTKTMFDGDNRNIVSSRITVNMKVTKNLSLTHFFNYLPLFSTDRDNRRCYTDLQDCRWCLDKLSQSFKAHGSWGYSFGNQHFRNISEWLPGTRSKPEPSWRTFIKDDKWKV